MRRLTFIIGVMSILTLGEPAKAQMFKSPDDYLKFVNGEIASALHICGSEVRTDIDHNFDAYYVEQDHSLHAFGTKRARFEFFKCMTIRTQLTWEE